MNEEIAKLVERLRNLVSAIQSGFIKDTQDGILETQIAEAADALEASQAECESLAANGDKFLKEKYAAEAELATARAELRVLERECAYLRGLTPTEKHQWCRLQAEADCKGDV